jgi:hypothetical protein
MASATRIRPSESLADFLPELCPLFEAAIVQDPSKEENGVACLDAAHGLGKLRRIVGWNSDRSGEVVIVSHQVPLSGRSSGC